MIYSKKLKDIREEKNITQEEISNVLNISRGVYSVYETENQIICFNLQILKIMIIVILLI